MSKLNFQGKYSKHNKKGRTFYIVLSACFVVLTAAAVLTYNGIRELTNKKESTGIVDSVKVPSENLKGTEKEDSLKFFEQDLKEDKDDYITTEEESETVEAKASKAGVIVNPTEQKEIIKKYSNNNPVYSKTFNDWRVHNGIDIKTEQGSKVKAITDGTVKEIYDDPLLGQTIVVEHDGGFLAYYSGLGNTTLVNVNDKVEAGKDIGSINDIPCEKADGYHLHLAIKKDDAFIDPLEILVDLK